MNKILSHIVNTVDTYLTRSASISNYDPLCVSVVTLQSCLKNAFYIVFIYISKSYCLKYSVVPQKG